MKKLIFTFISILVAGTLIAQESVKAGKVSVKEDKDKTVVNIGGNEGITVEETKDTTRIRLGNKGVTIIEDESGTDVKWSDIQEMDENENEGEEEEENGKKHKKFKPHWAGFEMGINNYLNNNFKMDLTQENAFMDLNTSRSWNFNINFIEYGLPLGTDKVGLVTGLGLEWSNYHFDDGNVIYEDDQGIIQPYVLTEENASVERAKLQTTYLTAPLLLEFQIPAGKKRIHVSGGVIGGVKLGSKTKMVYTVSGDKQKDKVKDDFNINPLRYGFTARVGYRGLKIFANYYATALFENNKGPELYPFSIGLSLISF